MLFPLGVVCQRNISLAGLPLPAAFITKSIERCFYMDKPTALSYGPLTACTMNEYVTHSSALSKQYGPWAVSMQLVGKNILTVGDFSTTVDKLD